MDVIYIGFFEYLVCFIVGDGDQIRRISLEIKVIEIKNGKIFGDINI